MLPPGVNSGPLSDVFKAKVTSLVQEQLQPIVTELAAQQQTLQTHLALLKHNHNVNDYQMTRLENIRNLEQSINFKVAGALGFDPWGHTSIGTNLREPVPENPLNIPQFVPIDHATPAERAAQSAALAEEAGMSARRLGVPLTTQEFPRDSAQRNVEDTMQSSIPLFGLGAPRWRKMQGLPPHKVPGTAAYDGIVAKPRGSGRHPYNKCSKKLKTPLCRQVQDGNDPYGIGAASNSSNPNSGAKDVPGGGSQLDIPPNREGEALALAQDSLAGTASAPPSAIAPTPTPTNPPSSAPARPGLKRCGAMADIRSTTPVRPRLRRCGAMADIRSTTGSGLRRNETLAHIGPSASATSSLSTSTSTITTTLLAARSAVSRAAARATVGSPPPAAQHTIGNSEARLDQQLSEQTSTTTTTTTTTTSTTSSSTSAVLEKPKRTTLKRGRRTAELDNITADDGGDAAAVEDQLKKEHAPGEGQEPPRKRRKRAAGAPSPSPTVGLGGDRVTVKVEACDESEGGIGGVSRGTETSQGSLRRSARVKRPPPVTAASKSMPVQRGRAKKGKRANARS